MPKQKEAKVAELVARRARAAEAKVERRAPPSRLRADQPKVIGARCDETRRGKVW